MQVYTTSNILMSIQSVSTRIDIIRFVTVILTVQFQFKLKQMINETNETS